MKRTKLLIIVMVAAAVGLFFWFDLQRFLTLENLKASHRSLLQFRAAHPVATVAAFIGIYVLQTALSLPGATVMSLAAGALFGSLWGTVYAVTGASAGATLAFLAVRYLLADVVLHRFGPRLEGLNRELTARGFNYLLFLRLVPLFPFFLINLAAGLTRLPLATFVAGTVLGIIPGGFVIVNAGASLASLESAAGLFSPRVLGSLGLLGLLALVPALYSRFSRRTA